MFKRIIKGQEALEFILITVLVFFGALFTMIVLGDKLAAFFGSGSSVAQSSGQTVAVINPGGTTKFAPDYATYVENEVLPGTTKASSIDVEGVTVTMNVDGSASFTVGTQNVTLPSELLALQDVMLQTSGSAGAQDLIKEVAYMIQKHAAEYPDANVPIEIAFGSGTRESTNGESEYLGKSSVNAVTLKVGDDIVIIQQDQACQSGGYYSDSCNFSGSYRIEGTVDSNNKITASVTSNIPKGDYAGEWTGTFTGTLNTSNGLAIDNASYKHVYDKYGSSTNYSWDLSFAKSDNTFQI